MILSPRFATRILPAALALACSTSAVAQLSPSEPPSNTNTNTGGVVLDDEVAILKSHGDLDGALAKASEEVQANPADFKAYIQRGDVYAKKKAWKEADQDFATALKLAPDNNMARFDLAELKLMQKQYDCLLYTSPSPRD